MQAEAAATEGPDTERPKAVTAETMEITEQKSKKAANQKEKIESETQKSLSKKPRTRKTKSGGEGTEKKAEAV
jgi:hypothetical protein